MKKRIIDLMLDKVNNVPLPEVIKYADNYYKLKNVDGVLNYQEYCPETKRVFDNYLEDDYYLLNILSDEVEILEDTPKEDKKIEKLGAFNIKKFYDDYPETAHFILAMFNKQEELIEKVNGE